MNLWVLPLGLLCGFVLTATAVSVFALWRAYRLLHQPPPRPGAQPGEPSGDIRELRHSVEVLAAQLHDLERHPPVAPIPAMPKPALNMCKRSQALRLHRQGEGPERIASTLELPRQEVELLLKVHRIVVANV
jgi:hypothetical protein